MSVSVTLLAGDCLERLLELHAASVDAVVTDPPYGISFMGQHWDRAFQAWVETWAVELLRVLKPGGHAVVLEGFDFIGIEREPDYLTIATARIAWWREHGERALAADASRRAHRSRSDDGWLDLLADEVA